MALGLVLAGRRGLRAGGNVDRVRLTAGDTLVETCTIEKRSIWPAAWLEVEWGNGDVQSLALPGGRTQTISHEWHLHHRGRYEGGGSWVRVRDPLGLMARIGARVPPVPVTVYPRPVPAPGIVAAVRARSARQDRRRPSELDETLGDLRDYMTGDPPSRIHWRTTARRGVLTVADPERQRRSSIWLLVDLGGDEDGTEEAAGIAAYLAAAFQGMGRPVGAIVAGESLAVMPERSAHESAGRILKALAEMPAASGSQADPLLRAAGQIRDPGCVVLVSAARGGEHLDLVRRLKTVHPRAEVVPAAGREAVA